MIGERMNRIPIYIIAYPKSGSTWLTRLLGDVLNSPTGGCMPEEDHKEIATEGQDRPGPWVIRKGHFTLTYEPEGPIVPRPHKLNLVTRTQEKTVLLVRDPRDICISGAYHWRVTPSQFLDRMIKGDVAKCGRWDRYVRGWLDKVDYWLRYEDLLRNGHNTLHFLLDDLDLFPIDMGQITQSLYRQSFKTRSQGLSEQDMRLNNLHKGVSGDWESQFTKDMRDRVWDEFGWAMEELGYEA